MLSFEMFIAIYDQVNVWTIIDQSLNHIALSGILHKFPSKDHFCCLKYF